MSNYKTAMEIMTERFSNDSLEIRLTDGMLIKDHYALQYQIDFTYKSARLSKNWGEFK